MNKEKEIKKIKKLLKEFHPEGGGFLSDYVLETYASLEDRLRELHD